LRSGFEPEAALAVLDELINAGWNAISGVTGTLIGPGAVPLAVAYVQWADRVEAQLRSLAIEQDLATVMHTERYWRVRQLHEEPVSPYQLVQAEIDQQTAWLAELRDDIRRRLDRVSAAPGDSTLLDTNVLVEFEPPQSVDWLTLVGSRQVRLIVPLRVIEELDEMKYDRRRADRAERARSAIRLLDGWVGAGGEPAEFRAATTIEVMLEPQPRERPADADAEILTVGSELAQYGGLHVRLVTGDMGLRLRAHASGLQVIRMPERYLRQNTPRRPG
jgi:rRNA-processing protein FCF1